MSEHQTDSGMWAEAEGTLTSDPHRARTGFTLRALQWVMDCLRQAELDRQPPGVLRWGA